MDNEKLKEEALTHIDKIVHKTIQFLAQEVRKVGQEIMKLDYDNDYFFTLHIIGTFLKEMCYSLEIYSIMNQKNFPAEKAIDAVKAIALSLMINKHEDFHRMTEAAIKDAVEKGHVSHEQIRQ